MDVSHISDFKGGWFIGNFEPTLLKNAGFEASIKLHKKGEHWPTHYHKIATEYNVVVVGRMTIQNQSLEAGNVFVLHPYEIADPVFHEDTIIVCIKHPGAANDKFEI
jgi:mannose-6-phosphate isomerase-like protein (cupin superfamily)